MTWKEYMQQEFGYKVKTTFWEDFSIAERFGESAVKDTYRRVLEEWKGNAVYLTEMVLVLNHKIWQLYQRNESMARVYDSLWRDATMSVPNQLKGADLEYYYRTTD